jgi:hypothetical protein
MVKTSVIIYYTTGSNTFEVKQVLDQSPLDGLPHICFIDTTSVTRDFVGLPYQVRQEETA